VDEEWEIPAALDGERVDRAIAIISGLSRRAAGELIDAGSISIGGGVVTSRSRRVRRGENLTVLGGVPLPSPPALHADPSVEVPVVWHDDQVIVVDKPAGLVVHPGAGNPDATVVHALLARFPDLAGLGGDRPGIVHRLDKGTSGLMVVARTLDAQVSLTQQLASRRMTREYLTLVAGNVESEAGLIDAPLGRSETEPTKIRVQSGGRAARTRYEVESRFDYPMATTLLKCHLETGRTHQIRVHLASIGHPVVGDERYRGPRIDHLARPFLHASALAFDHPRSGERVDFLSPLPDDLRSVLATIRHGT
jgi:23S rRNA pseudouridine1911/1915/1917 synthase